MKRTVPFYEFIRQINVFSIDFCRKKCIIFLTNEKEEKQNVA